MFVFKWHFACVCVCVCLLGASVYVWILVRHTNGHPSPDFDILSLGPRKFMANFLIYTENCNCCHHHHHHRRLIYFGNAFECILCVTSPFFVVGCVQPKRWHRFLRSRLWAGLNQHKCEARCQRSHKSGFACNSVTYPVYPQKNFIDIRFWLKWFRVRAFYMRGTFASKTPLFGFGWVVKYLETHRNYVVLCVATWPKNTWRAPRMTYSAKWW